MPLSIHIKLENILTPIICLLFLSSAALIFPLGCGGVGLLDDLKNTMHFTILLRVSGNMHKYKLENCFNFRTVRTDSIMQTCNFLIVILQKNQNTFFR